MTNEWPIRTSIQGFWWGAVELEAPGYVSATNGADFCSGESFYGDLVGTGWTGNHQEDHEL